MEIDDLPTGAPSEPLFHPGTSPGLHGGDFSRLVVSTHATMANLKTGSTFAEQDDDMNTNCIAGLFHQDSDIWSAYSGPWLASLDQCASISSHEPGTFRGGMLAPQVDEPGGTVNVVSGLAVATPDGNYRPAGVSDGILCSEVLPNRWGTVSLNLFDEAPALFDLNHAFGGHDNPQSTLDPGMLDSGVGFPAVPDNLIWSGALRSGLHGVNHDVQPDLTLASLSATPIWNDSQAPLAGELLLNGRSCTFPDAIHNTGLGLFGAQDVLAVPLDPSYDAMLAAPAWFAPEDAGSTALTPEVRSGVVAGLQSGNVADSDAALPTNTRLGSLKLSVSAGDAAKHKPQAARKRNRHSPAEWEEAYVHLRRLYVEKGYTAEEVTFDMAVIHGFEASLPTYEKRLASLGKDTRLRTAKALPDPSALEAEIETPKMFEIVSERVRSVRAEKQQSERTRRKEEREKRRQLQVAKGNIRGRKKRDGMAKEAVPCITQARIPPSLRTVYEHQEELFHAIDAFCKGLFAAGDKSWTADSRHFRPPPGTPDSSRAWQLLSDQVAGVKMLVEGQLYHHANFLLGQVLAGLRAAARIRDPSFLVHFWTMCNLFSNIPVRSRGKLSSHGSPYLGWFLRQLKQILASVFGRHAVVDIVDSLLRVWTSSPRDLKPTLGLGHWKAIHTLGTLIGSKHNIVLNMGVRCTRAWKSKFSASAATLEFLRQSFLAAIVVDTGNEAEYIAEVSLDHLFAAGAENTNEPDVILEASKLLDWTRGICREKAHLQVLTFDSVARAFVFSSELVAKYFLESHPGRQGDRRQNSRPDREASYKYMDDAIEILRHGDTQCRIRAASFSKLLLTWIKGHPEKMGEKSRKEAMQAHKMRVLNERARLREIVRTITKQRIKGSNVRKKRGDRKVKENRPLVKNLLLESLSG